MNQTLAKMNSEQPEQLFSEARAAFEKHRHISLEKRLSDINKIKNKILEDQELIIDALTQELGKSRTDALVAEILGTLDWIQWVEDNAAKILAPEKIKTPITLLGKKSLVFHEPYGVVLIICPWNYPFHNAITGIVAAFITGNAVVYKPSEHSPCYGLVEKVLDVAPIIKESVRIAYGDGAMGSSLISQKPGKIFFTGSGATGQKIMAQASQDLIPVELELGGKDPLIVFDDTSVKRAAAASLWGAFTNAGQSCSAVERLLVQEGIYSKFLAELLAQAAQIVVKPEDHGDADIGRMTTLFQKKKVIDQLQDALGKGAKLEFGSIPKADDLNITPMILTGVTSDMEVWSEETFGPILPIMKFVDEKDGISKANDSEYGLCASVFTNDKEKALRVTRALDVGGVSVNNVNMTEGNPGLPFGGAKKSGFGKLRGAEGLRGFTRGKSVLIDSGSDKIEANWYPYTKTKYTLFQKFIAVLYNKSPLKLLKIAFTGLRLESFSQKPRK